MLYVKGQHLVYENNVHAELREIMTSKQLVPVGRSVIRDECESLGCPEGPTLDQRRRLG